MEEESYGSSSERSSTSREESAPYSTDNSSHATNPMNSEEEEEEEESSSSDDYPSKRRKHGPIVEEEDRISTLPDSILLTILSSLCTKDAVRTGVLSKRWAYLWTFVPSLRFTDYYFRHAADRANFVDNVLLLHRASKLTNFSVEVEYNPELKPCVDLWVRFATTAKVDQLSLLLSSCFYKLPQHLYANEFVSELNFRACEIKPNGLVRWSSLKRLCLWNLALHQDVLNKVLLGSPRLEFLELRNCDKFNRLDIVSESLKKLVMDSYDEDYPLELEIVAPKIESLEIIGDFYGMKKCQIKNASALVEVRVDFVIRMEYEDEEQEEDHYKNCENVVRELFESLNQVKKLIVGRWCLKVLSIMSVKHLSSPVLNCKCLTMKTSMEKWDLPGIASLLQNSPYVETLVIDIIFSNHDLEFLDRIYDEVNHWKSKEVYFKSLLQCLKTVKIFGFGERFHTKDVFILVVEFLLKNAKVLEKMVITEPWVMQNGIHNMQLKFLQVSQKLLSFPRISPHAVVMFPF